MLCNSPIGNLAVVFAGRFFTIFQVINRRKGPKDARCRVLGAAAYICPCLIKVPLRVPILNVFSFGAVICMTDTVLPMDDNCLIMPSGII